MEAKDFTYGSDASGLVWGFLIRRAAPPEPLDAAQALAWLAEPAAQAPDAFAWLHFNLSNAASEKWMKSQLSLPEEFYEALHQGSRSTRIERAEDTLIAVVNDVQHDFSFESAEISSLWLSVGRHVVISARGKPLQSIERLRQAVRGGEAIRSPMDLLNHLLRDQGDILVKIVRDAVAQVDEIEDKLLAGRLQKKRADLGAMRRVLVRLRRLLAPEPAAMFRLMQKPPAWIDEFDIQELRQSTEEFSMVLSDMAALQERIKLLQEEIAASVNEENSRSLFVLTILTVLALPINIIAGLFGMNVGGVPLANDPDGFWLVAGIVTAFAVVGWWLAVRYQKK